MALDELLEAGELPPVGVDAGAALADVERRGRVRRRRRRAGIGGACVGLAAIAVLVGVVSTDSGDGSQIVAGPRPATAIPATPEPGDPATWDVDPDAPPSAGASTFTALVTRAGCHSGVTGTVLRPGVVFEDGEVVVTFTVARAGDGFYACPGNDQVPYEVDLGQPLGDRRLVDGGCGPGAEASGTSYCESRRGVRWPPVATIEGLEVESGPQGNERVAVELSSPLLDDTVAQIESWAGTTGQRVEYLVQDFPELVTCGDRHQFPASAGGSIDVLIPADWLDRPWTEDGELLIDADDAAEKVVVCPPRGGVVQIAFWGMGPSAQAPDVSVTISEDRRRILVENR
jgi:hypothetical protein